MHQEDRVPAPARARTILVVAMSGVELRPKSVFIDRKFHVGMLEYMRRIDRPLACVVPRMSVGDVRGMDHIDVPMEDVGYRLNVVSSLLLPPADRELVERAIAESALVYVGGSEPYNIVAAELARAHDVPYVAVTEYTLRTELDIMRVTTPALLRRVVRELRLRYMHRRKLDLIAGAAEVHANGYPTYLELAPVNPRRLLYFDTRALQSDVISEAAVLRRLHSLPSRRPRLLYSGRYHAMKGALDVVKAGVQLDRLGLDFELDLYGTGPLKEEMVAWVQKTNTAHKIAVHDAIPYKPDLVDATREADLFLCCHVQGDPSCTYLETYACGVPIVGYANEMWSELSRESGGGRAVRVGDHRLVAAAAWDLLRDGDRLREASLRARQFALANTMEKAWDRRSARLVALALAAEAARAPACRSA